MSDYCNTYRIEVELPDGSSEVFFEKEGAGEKGRGCVESAFTSESATYEFAPEHVPRPVTMGTYKSHPDKHFFLAQFIEMIEDDIPRPESYMAAVAALHSRSMGKSPSGKFGFPVNTRFGDLEQDNSWTASWEEYWTRQMGDFLNREDAAHNGEPHKELERLRPLFFEKVLPRYLRPLESDGRSVTPCLIHADLWPGNVKYMSDGDTVCMYDACAMWAHNEGRSPIFSRLLHQLTSLYSRPRCLPQPEIPPRQAVPEGVLEASSHLRARGGRGQPEYAVHAQEPDFAVNSLPA
jgi:fructosamine-3-kinase